MTALQISISVGLGVAALLLVLCYRVLRQAGVRQAPASALTASEETYRAMVVALSDGVIIFDDQGHVKGVNPAAERFLGRSAAELHKNELTDWNAIDTNGRPIPASELPVAKALAEQRPQRGAVVGLTDPTGVLSWFEVTVEPLHDAASGRLRGAVASIADVTKRRQVESELVASEANHRLLMNSLLDGMFVAQDYRFVFANLALPRMLGYEPEAFVDVPFEQVVAPDVLPVWNARFTQRVSDQPEPVRAYEVRFLKRGGVEQIELELVATRTVYRGRPAVLGLVRDITERKKVALELEGYRNRLEKLVEERTHELTAALAARAATETFAQTITDNQPTLLAYIDPGFRLQFANRAYLQWFGKTREEMVGQLLIDVLGHNALGGREELLSRVLGGEALEAPLDLLDGGGQLGHFWAYRLPDLRHGKVHGYFFIATNVTELRRAQERLQQADAFSRLIADNIPGRVSYWDRDLRCGFVNEVYCAWFGRSREELLGQTIETIFGAERAARIAGPVQAALRGEAQHFERQETSADGRSATTLLHYRPDMRGGEVRGFFVLALDVTQSRQAEQTLQRLNSELVVARDKAQAAAVAKSAFLANMSHEIRTPMNAIVGLTHLLRRDPDGPAAPDRLARVSAAADHLMGMLNDILDLSKIESGKLELEHAPFDLPAAVTRAVGMVQEQARQKGLALPTETTTLPRWVLGDATRLSQALVNLLANAVKFTETGSVSLTGTLEAVQGSDLHIRFEVRDTGIGIEPDRIEGIFNAFEQADGSTTRRFGGTGLGLGITRQIARLMGGDAGATSVPNVGSVFWIAVALQRVAEPVELPHLPSHSSTERDAQVETAADAGETLRRVVTDVIPATGVRPSPEHRLRTRHQGARVLLAEDNPVNQDIGTTLLEMAGLQVEVAQNGREAVDKATQSPFRVILMDIQMPEIDGLQATRLLRANATTAAIPIIAMTANAYAEDRAECLAAGMNDYLTKPVDPALLYEVLGRWLSVAEGEGGTRTRP